MKHTKDKDEVQEKNSPGHKGENRKDLINRQLNALPPVTLKIGLLVIGIFMAVVSLTMLIRPFGDRPMAPALLMDRIMIPDIPKRDNTPGSGISGHDEYGRIFRLRETLDDLLKNSDQHRYDSIMAARPGLKDSLDAFVKHYQLHFLPK